MAALLNAVKLTGRRMEDLRVLVIGLGAAGIAVTKILREAGVRDIVGADSRGALHVRREDYLDGTLNPAKRWFAEVTNPECRAGAPADVIDGTDLLIGVSGARALPAEALAKMNDDAMVFAMANPNPEVVPEEAAPYVRIMATGRSDYPNQINNVLCFPGIFRGALDVRAPAITEADEDGRRPCDRRDRPRGGVARGLHHPVRLQPRRRARGGGGRSRAGARERHGAGRPGGGLRAGRHPHRDARRGVRRCGLRSPARRA